MVLADLRQDDDMERRKHCAAEDQDVADVNREVTYGKESQSDRCHGSTQRLLLIRLHLQ